jgi:HAE1 family hydrophobic/amphiphilic exporter-1
MFSRFFIDRPRFALVVSIVIVLAGLLSLTTIPVAQFPPITPPVVQVTASYPGASAEVVETSVTIPLEEEINGVDNMLYLSSKSTNSGQIVLTVTFEVGTNPDMALVNVQNRVARAEAKLPEEVTRLGITVQKKSTNILLFINLFSPKKSLNDLFISNYATLHLRDRLLRLPGVAEVALFGAHNYSMRIWLDPERMSSLGVSATDIVRAIREQNIQVAAGQVGQMPTDAEQQFQYTLHAKGRLSDVQEFENIIVRAKANGSIIQIKDLARVELGAENYDSRALLDGGSTTILALYQQPAANALETSEALYEAMQQLARNFPDGLEYTIIYDTTRFVEEAVEEVVVTLFLAVLFVIGVIYLFLQDWRSTLIPMVTIPVSLIGTLAALNVMDYSINTITLFGLILAIGTVVDDAIVVIENVQRLISEGVAPRKAAIQSMRQVTSPIIATTLVLLAVFVPVGFIPGITGQLYQQFAVTVSVAVLFSTLNALTLSPALCAVLLKGAPKRPGLLLRGFNRGYNTVAHAYRRTVTVLVRRVAWVLLAFGVLLGLTYSGFRSLPSAFLPEEDQGYFFVNIQLPEGAALPRTEQVMREVGKIMANTPGVDHVIEVVGFNLIAGTNASNSGLAVAVLTPWSERRTPPLKLGAIMKHVKSRVVAIPQANIFAFNPPSISGLGRTGGFEYQLQDTTGQDIQGLAAVLRGLLLAANQAPELMRVFSTFQADVPQIFIDLDRRKAKTLGIPLEEIFDTLQIQFGSLYVNDFNKFGRVYQVRLQSDKDFRNDPNDIYRLYVRNQNGKMIPLRTLLSTTPIIGSGTISRHNLFRAVQINGTAAPGYSSGDAIAAMERLSAQTLPEGMSFEWSGMSLQEIKAGSQTPILFSLALLFVYLVLVAQYESWSIPFAVILSVPVAAFGAITAQFIMGLNNDIYGQIGLIMLIGLASKHAILIVEFALQQRKTGVSTQQAAVTAARLRFRAVMMTAFSFILGVVPLVLATGAAAASRHSLGTPVLGGMIAAAVLGTIVVPVFYVAIQHLTPNSYNNQV